MGHRLRSRIAGAFALACVALVLPVATGCGDDDERSAAAGEPRGKLFVQLLRPGEPLAVIDLPGGEPVIPRSSAELMLAGGDPPFRLIATGGRLVYYGAGGTYAIDLDLRGRPQRLSEAWYFVPSAREGRVWLTFLDPESPATVRDLRSVAEVTVGGRVTAPPGARPPCRGPTVVAAVRGAVVCQGHELRAFDPASGEVLMRFPGPFPLDTHGTLVASCGEPCPSLHISDVETGRDTAIEPGRGFRFEASYEGAFSPDGSLLAAPVITQGSGRGSPERNDRRRVALIDVAEGTARVIPGSRLADHRNIAWSSSGEWLFFEAAVGRVMAYRPGSDRARLLPFELESHVLDMAAG